MFEEIAVGVLAFIGILSVVEHYVPYKDMVSKSLIYLGTIALAIFIGVYIYRGVQYLLQRK